MRERALRLVSLGDLGRNCDVWMLGRALYVVGDRTGERPAGKIGVASHPIRRLSSLQCGNQRPLEIERVWVGDSAYQVERLLHAHFAHKRLFLEWFDVTAEEVDHALTEMQVTA